MDSLLDRRGVMMQNQSSITPIDYLGFSGTQYINTLITPLFYPGTLNFKIEYRSYCPMSWGWASQNQASKIWIGSGDKKAFWSTYSTSQVFNNPAKSTWHTYIFDADSGFYIDGNKEVNFTATIPSSTATSANSVPLYIGTTWDTTAQVVDNYTDGHLALVEYVKIWNNDVLVRDFIPVLFGGNGYFYDRVSGQLFGNSGTGSFVLPKSLDDYVRIEYLQSTNASGYRSYLATQYYPTPNTKVVLEGALNNTNLGGPFMGLYDSASPYKRFHIGTYQGKWHFGIGTTNAGNTWINFNSPAIDTNKHTFILQGNGYCSVDSTSNTISPNNTSTYNIPFYIFSQSYTGSQGQSFGFSRIWSIKIYENDVLTMELIPCRDENNVGYLYDTISKQTFGNAGTGSFVLGPDVLQFYDYLTFDGTAYIQTDLLLPENGSVRTYLYNMTKKQCGIFRALDNSNNMVFGLEVGGSDANNHRFNIRYYKTTNDDSGAYAWGNYNSGQVYMTSSRCQVPGRLKIFTKGSVMPTKGIQLVYARNNASGNIFKGSMSTFHIYGSDTQSVTSWAAFEGFTPVYTLRPCTYYGEAGMWCVETNTFYGNSASSGTLTVSNA